MIYIEENSQLIDEYLHTLTYVRKISKHTIISYRHHLTHFASFVERNEMSLKDVSSLDARKNLSTVTY